MSMIKIENLTFSYPSGMDYVFEHASFQIDTAWRLGFVGRNGRGKTTLFKLLMGEYEYSGKIISSEKFDYFPYDVKDKNKITLGILQEICPRAEEWEIIRELSYLEADYEILYRPFNTLSNGEQTKALLAALFLNEGNFLLIDEPTNHLDVTARQQVAQYLKRKKSFILVSHDREFLDTCVDHILSINKSDIEVQSGNFSSFIRNFEQVQQAETLKNEHLKKDIKRLQQASKRSAIWSSRVESSKIGAYDKGYVGHKAAKMMKRSKAIEARTEQAIEEKAALLKNAEKAEDLKLFPLSFHSSQLAEFTDVCALYNGIKAFSPVSFTVKNGERIALCGKNGSGKSSVLKLLLGQIKNYTGNVHKGSGLIISYVPQNADCISGSVFEFARKSNVDESLLKMCLSKLDFHSIQFEKDISSFSAGQKKKLLLAKSLCEKAHLYVWDEPLNYIDIYSRIQIEQLIKAFSPTMLFVEHDRSFVDSVATRKIVL